MVKKLINIKDFNWEGKVILIVEDDYPSYMFLHTIITYARGNTVHIQNGIDAIEYCKENNIDLILMDIQLPGISGFEATSEIKKFKPALPIVAQTAFALKGERERSLDAGCDDYITKPIDKNNLVLLIDKYLNN